VGLQGEREFKDFLRGNRRFDAAPFIEQRDAAAQRVEHGHFLRRREQKVVHHAAVENRQGLKQGHSVLVFEQLAIDPECTFLASRKAADCLEGD